MEKINNSFFDVKNTQLIEENNSFEKNNKRQLFSIAKSFNIFQFEL